MQKTNLKAVLMGISPDDLPLVGPMKHFPNVYLNVGHGARASTLAFKCGKMLKDQMLNEETDVELKTMSPRRFHI